MKKQKEKFVVIKSSYVDKDGNTVFEDNISQYKTEKQALIKLKTLDADLYHIEHRVWAEIGNGIYDWDYDDGYGSCNGMKFLYDFKEKTIKQLNNQL